MSVIILKICGNQSINKELNHMREKDYLSEQGTVLQATDSMLSIIMLKGRSRA